MAHVPVDVEEPTPDARSLFQYYDHLYFGGKLQSVEVKWSTKRMTRCAGVCHYEGRGGLCCITLSEPLLKFRSNKDLKCTLLHEMIHAYLFLNGGYKLDRSDHGELFQSHMRRINTSGARDEFRPRDGYDVTIYHSFRDEVDLYLTHWWQCPRCMNVVKRSMNRPPSEKDCFRALRGQSCSDARCAWHMHERHCGGAFLKIREPEGYRPRKRKGEAAAADGSTFAGPAAKRPRAGGSAGAAGGQKRTGKRDGAGGEEGSGGPSGKRPRTGSGSVAGGAAPPGAAAAAGGSQGTQPTLDAFFPPGARPAERPPAAPAAPAAELVVLDDSDEEGPEAAPGPPAAGGGEAARGWQFEGTEWDYQEPLPLDDDCSADEGGEGAAPARPASPPVIALDGDEEEPEEQALSGPPRRPRPVSSSPPADPDLARADLRRRCLEAALARLQVASARPPAAPPAAPE